MPYESAKHLAATFCYHIRYALVPLFGPDFASLCCPPDDPAFGRMIISQDIVRQCTAAARETRCREEYSNGLSSLASHRGPSSAESKAVWKWKRMQRGLCPMTAYSESGYGTDTDTSDQCPLFPHASSEKAWKQADARSRSSRAEKDTRDRFEVQMPPTPTTMVTAMELSKEKRSISQVDENNSDYNDDDDDDDAGDDAEDNIMSDSLSDDSTEPSTTRAKRRKSGWSPGEARAAYMLMQLYVADSTLGEEDEESNPRRRAASSPPTVS